jgi:hypothetical protein
MLGVHIAEFIRRRTAGVVSFEDRSKDFPEVLLAFRKGDFEGCIRD